MSVKGPNSAAGQSAGRPRLWRWALWAALATLVIAFAVFFVISSQILKNHSQQITIGMPRDRVVEILGPPYLSLQKGPRGLGDTLVWTDIFWQVDVVIGDDDRVLQYRCVPANSQYRRTQAKISSLFK